MPTQQKQFKPYLIADMKTGKMIGMEPWLIPQDAFETVKNAHLEYGYLEKRRGYTQFAQFKHTDTAAGTNSNPGNAVMGIWNHYTTSGTEELLIMDTKRVNKYSSGTMYDLTRNKIHFDHGTSQDTTPATDDVIEGATSGAYGTVKSLFTDNGDFGDGDASGTIVFKNTTVSGTFQASEQLQYRTLAFTDGGTTEIEAGDTITGLTGSATAVVWKVTVTSGTWAGGDAAGTLHLRDQTGTFESENIGNDGTTDHATIAGDSTVKIIGDSTAAASDEEFTCTDSDYFWMETWKGISYITNNKDPIQKYNGTDLAKLYVDLDTEGGPDNDISSCLMTFVYKSRLILLRTNESGTAHNQRARWCDINDPEVWPADNYVDAPTEDWIISADFMGEDLVVWFERSIWKLIYTGDVTLPFRWEKIADTEGCYASFSLTTFSDEQICIGPTRIVATDGREVYGIDDRIPDYMLTWNPDAIEYCFGLVLEEESQMWISFPSQGQSKPDNVLVMNYVTNSFSVYNFYNNPHCFGYSSLDDSVTWDDYPTTSWDELAITWDDRSLQGGYPTTLMGDRSGYIYQVNDSDSDYDPTLGAGQNIEMEVISGRWNPYSKDGLKAEMGYIDFLVDKNSIASFDVQLYADSESSSYRTVTVSCADTGTSRGKVWKRVHANCIADFHRIEITNNATGNRPVIHAIVPYFRPVDGGLV